jgi:uncharacterized protein YciI
MDFLVYSRAVPESDLPEHTAAEERALNERHWSYLDGFADRLTARGPTLGPSRDTWTGSLHIVDLPDADAVRAFVEEEPYQRIGLFAEHAVWHFDNLLGRTMWEFSDVTEEPTYLVLVQDPSGEYQPAPVEDLSPAYRDRLVVYGALTTVGGDPAGVALTLQAPSRDALDTWLTDPALGLSGSEQVEVHDWEFGGRR